jgi:hypothetical protein
MIPIMANTVLRCLRCSALSASSFREIVPGISALLPASYKPTIDCSLTGSFSSLDHCFSSPQSEFLLMLSGAHTDTFV